MSTDEVPFATQIANDILAAEDDAPIGEVLSSLPPYLQDGVSRIAAPLLRIEQAPTLSFGDPHGSWVLTTMPSGELLVGAFSDDSAEIIYAPRLVTELLTSPSTTIALVKEIVYMPWEGVLHQ